MATNGGECVVDADGLHINLRRPAVAAVLAWLIPGGGHFYQKRYGKAALYSFSILSIYVIGMLIGSGRVVYASWKPDDRRWHYICQIGVGLPALPALLQYYRDQNGQPPLWDGFMAQPRDSIELSHWHSESASGFDLGCLYTMIAGLLNFLVIFDAYSGPMPVPGTEKAKSDDD